MQYLNLKQQILDKIKNNGGWVNCHGHFDRAYSLTDDLYKLANAQRSEKWRLNKELRINSTVEDIYSRMSTAVERMIEQGVTATATFIDVDPDVRDKSMKAAQKVREFYKNDITIKYINQSSYGLFDKESRKWFEEGARFVDIIGGLPKADKDRASEHMDILLGTAKSLGKMVHVHVDELNLPEEEETKLLAEKTIEFGMEGHVVGVHGISINCHPIEYRKKLYTLLKKAKIMFITCPMSWINSRRSEILAPIHNPVLPVDEMIDYDIPIGIGIDNIADIFMPYNDADMWNDLRLCMETNRLYDIDTLVKIATVNGRKILGL